MDKVSVLEPKEGARLDPDRLNALHAQLGRAAAEDVICRAMEELAVRLSYIDEMYRTRDWDCLRKSTRALIAIAEQIGMMGLARAASSVIDCIDICDTAALASTLSRLNRLGEKSLTAVWDLQDLSI